MHSSPVVSMKSDQKRYQRLPSHPMRSVHHQIYPKSNLPLVSMKSTQMRYQLLQTLCFSLTDVGLLFLFSPQAPPGAQTALRESTPQRPVCVWACVRKRV